MRNKPITTNLYNNREHIIVYVYSIDIHIYIYVYALILSCSSQVISTSIKERLPCFFLYVLSLICYIKKIHIVHFK